MSDQPVSLNEARANKLNDNCLWTPEDCVTAFLRDMKAGVVRPTKIVLIYEEDIPEGGGRISVYLANVKRDQEIALLEMRKHFAMHKWAEQ